MGLYYSLNFHKPVKEYQKNDELTVVVIYYHDGKKLKISSDIKVQLKDWGGTSTNPIQKSDTDHKSKNILCKSLLSEVEGIIHKIIINGQNPEVSLIKQYLKQVEYKKVTKTRKDVEFSVLFKEYGQQLMEDVVISHNYKRNVINSLNQITYFIKEKYNGIFFLVSNFDEDFQNEYKNYSVESHQRNNVTIQKHIKHLNGFMKWCLKNKYVDYPFTTIKIPTNTDNEVIYLLRDEIENLFHFTDFNYNSPNHLSYTKEYVFDFLKSGNTTTYTNLEVYKDMLLFGCGVGCRFGDLVNLRLDNYEFGDNRRNGYFIFRMEKTHKQVKVPMNKLTFEVWKKYSSNKKREDFIFPRTSHGNPISNQKMNENLKVIGEIVGLNRLVRKPIFNSDNSVRKGTEVRKPLYQFMTSHIIRRTFIREGLNSGLPRHVIMEMSGHSTEKEFNKYFSVIESEREKVSSLFSYDLNPSEDIQVVTQPTLPSNELNDKLIRLKELFDNGLIPEDLYKQKVSELLSDIS